VKVTPVAPVRAVFNSLRKTIFRRGGSPLKELPFSLGDRVSCLGFEGKTYDGTVTVCEFADAGYAKFVRVRVRLDISKKELQINWTLFPDRIKLKERET
jgi:hypothetical protein